MAETSAWKSTRGQLPILAAGVLGFSAIAVTISMPAEEDALIYYRYAWNWAHGHGLVFNPGDPVEGFSGPIWMALLALLAWAGLDLPMAGPALGIVFGAAALVATDLLARTVGLSGFARVAVIAALACSYPFTLWARSGLETPLYSLAIVLACAAYLRVEYPSPDDPPARPSLRPLAALAPVIVALGRPEGLLLVLLLVADRLTDRRDYLGAARYALPSVLGYGGYLIVRFLTFHSLVPNTSVKLYPLLIERSAGQFLAYLLYAGALTVTLPVLGLLATRRSRVERRRLGLLFSAVCLLSFAFHFIAGGDYHFGFRYMIPTLPLLLVAIWYAFELLRAAEGGATRLLASALAPGLLLALCLSGPLLLLTQRPPRLVGWHREVFEPWRDPFQETSHWGVRIARWMEAHVPKNSVVAFGQMGRVPYFMAIRNREITFIDTLGLVDRSVAQIYRIDRKLTAFGRDLWTSGSPGQALELGRQARANRMAESVLGRRPDFLLIETDLESYRMMKALLEHPELASSYHGIDQPSLDGVRIYARRQFLQ